MPGRDGWSVRRHLALFTVALALPMLLLLGLVFWRFASAERLRFERETADIAQSVALSIDRDLTGMFASLDVLSTSAFLLTGDLEGFHRQVTELLARQGITAVLLDPTGKQLVNARIPWGAPLPQGSLTLDRAALGTGRPFVTNATVGRVTGTRQVLATIPVMRANALAYVLFFSLPLSRLQQFLAETDLGRSFTAAVLDREGTIIARSRRPEEFVGQPAAAEFRKVATEPSGTWDGVAIDGAPVFVAYHRSRLSGFVASVSIAHSDLNAPLWRSLSLFAALGAGLAALGAGLALFVGKRITGPIARLARTAEELGRGREIAPLSSGLTEANQVGRVLATASAALREREAELRDANEESQRFAYIVSHDLRSPLVNIMGFTSELEALRDDVFARLAALKAAAAGPDAGAGPAGQSGPAGHSGPAGQSGPKDDELAADFDEALGFIKASISKMDRLINAILRLSREGRRAFHPERVDMNALLEAIKATHTVQASGANAVVTATPLPPLVSDRLALEQIFSNLVDNALKYLRHGVPGTVEISGTVRGRLAVYEVKDNGRGIEGRDADRVFDLFRRSGPQDRPGEGIGLAHVRALVRRLGGIITLTSLPGQGSTFTVTLPRRWSLNRNKDAA